MTLSSNFFAASQLQRFLKRKPKPQPKPMTTQAATVTTLSSYERNRVKTPALVDDGLSRLANRPGLPKLLSILGYNRPGNSPGEERMIDLYLKDFEADDYGNRFHSIAHPDGTPPSVMFTAHTDTVSMDTRNLIHPLCYNRAQDVLFRNNGEVLGADDGTGVWLLLEMISAGVPGLYCFFRDEEAGRLGSEASLKADPKRYADIDICVSFDRKGTSDVITTQRGDRCCSDTFGAALAKMLNAQDPTFNYKHGARGSFTDSATFMDHIPECTNLSVGYDKQHTASETQLVDHLFRLRDAVVKMDWHSLPIERDPVEQAEQARLEAEAARQAQWGNWGYAHNNSYWDGYDSYYGDAYDRTLSSPTSDDGLIERNFINMCSVEDLVIEYPEIIATLLESYGFDEVLLRTAVIEHLGLDESDSPCA